MEAELKLEDFPFVKEPKGFSKVMIHKGLITSWERESRSLGSISFSRGRRN